MRKVEKVGRVSEGRKEGEKGTKRRTRRTRSEYLGQLFDVSSGLSQVELGREDPRKSDEKTGGEGGADVCE